MSLKKIIQHAIVITFLTVTFSGLMYTFTPTGRRGLPFIPRLVTYFSYGMMGPWQGYLTSNTKIYAEGYRRDGVWEPIFIWQYIPFWNGETSIRSRYWMFIHHFGRGSLPREYRKYALLIKKREFEKGRDYLKVRLGFDTWPKSTEGFYTLRTPFFTTKRILAEVP